MVMGEHTGRQSDGKVRFSDLLEPTAMQVRFDAARFAIGGWLHPMMRWRILIGGQPFATIDDRAVAARASWGKGTVTALGFASRFGDQNMGITGDTDLTPELRPVYDYQFRLLRWIVEGTSPVQPSTLPAAGESH